MKFQKITEKGEDDVISALPDFLLIEILSRLPSTKEAIRTGTLSKRWKYLWRSVHTLIFTHSDTPITQSPPNPKSNSDFVSFVDKTLTQCRQLKLKKFQLDTKYHVEVTTYDLRFQSEFNKWIRYAIGCNVEQLNLDFTKGLGAEFVLDQSIFMGSCFTDLRLAGCIINPTGPISWNNLRSLCIINGKLDYELIKNILFGSPVLETLELGDCYGYSKVDITSKSVKKLVISGYKDELSDANIIEINAPNILSLKIEGILELWKVLLENVSSVVEANLNYYKFGFQETSHKEVQDEMLKRFIQNLCHVKELKIGSYCSKALSRLEQKGFDFPSNIKFPEDAVDWFDSDLDESEDL